MRRRCNGNELLEAGVSTLTTTGTPDDANQVDALRFYVASFNYSSKSDIYRSRIHGHFLVEHRIPASGSRLHQSYRLKWPGPRTSGSPPPHLRRRHPPNHENLQMRLPWVRASDDIVPLFQ